MSDREPEATLSDLYATLLSRKGGDPELSYTARLFAQGPQQIAKKLGEEAVEAALAGALRDRDGLIGESADLLYHLLVLWADQNVRPEEVMARLRTRAGRSGLTEKAERQKR